MKRGAILPAILALAIGLSAAKGGRASDELEAAFLHPPAQSQLGAFWFWSNTVVREGIRRDLEAMQRVGIERVVLSPTRAHSATVEEGGVVFLSPPWLKLFRYALDEAQRLGIQVSAVMSNGWYQGGPWVTPELGAQMLVWSETPCTGPSAFDKALAAPNTSRNTGRWGRITPEAREHLRPVAVLAYQHNAQGELLRETLVRLDERIGPEGKLSWPVPPGAWTIFRFAHVPNLMKMKQDSPGYTGLQIDHLSAAAIGLHFRQVGLPMLEAAGPHVGQTLDYFHEDSMELGHYDWTADFPRQFQARRQYDLLPWLPILAGKTFAGLPGAGRVEADFLRTIDDLLADEHYGPFLALCHQHGLKLQTEGGDIHGSVRVKARCDRPMGEFWTHRDATTDLPRALTRNAIFAGRVYGRSAVSFEAFTSSSCWLESPASLKPLADELFCLGANHFTLHGFSYSRPQTPPPGDIYFAGTHFNPQVTWWRWAGDFFAYLNRCQALLAQGQPVVDLLYLDGPTTQAMASRDPSPGARRRYDFDVVPGERLAADLGVLPDGRVAFAHGMTYRMLVVAEERIEPEVLAKIAELVERGATLWMQAIPCESCSWTAQPQADQLVARLVAQLTGGQRAGRRKLGKGTVIVGPGPAEEVLSQAGIAPDFAYVPARSEGRLSYAHRQAAGSDVYFVANRQAEWDQATCVFRVDGKRPECWDPVTGKMQDAAAYENAGGVVRVPLRLAPCGSVFVVFRRRGPNSELHSSPAASPAVRAVRPPLEVAGPWQITFQPARPGETGFALSSRKLFLWNESEDLRIRHFAGIATYAAEVTVDAGSLADGRRAMLDLGEVDQAAEVALNGKPCGAAWCQPFRFDLTDALVAGKNRLEVRVCGVWHNWNVAHGEAYRFHAWTIRSQQQPLVKCGLVGPVRLYACERGEAELP